MKKAATLFAAFALSTPFAFAQNLSDTVPKAETKIEQFSAKTGVVIIKGFEEIGSLQGLYSTSVNIESKEFSNVSDGTKQYGITIQAFKENGKYDKKHTSFIDYDEIDSLIQGIEYIGKVKPDATKFKDFQADYSTRGNLKISTFNSSDRLMAAVSSGRVGAVAAYFNLQDLDKLKSLIIKAKEKIEQNKS